MTLLITITGRAGSGKTNIAQARFNWYCSKNPMAHVVMLDEGEVQSSQPSRPIYLADVLIRTKLTQRGICEFREFGTLTPTCWFPPEINPERPGVYEVESVIRGPWFAYFDGKHWGCMTQDGPEAAVQKYTEHPITRHASRRWRGLAANLWGVA